WLVGERSNGKCLDAAGRGGDNRLPLQRNGNRAIAADTVHFDREGLRRELAAAGHAMGDPAHVRILKRERRLELWMQGRRRRYSLFRSYDICAFSGGLGPKQAEGDLQAPEGFYKVGS